MPATKTILLALPFTPEAGNDVQLQLKLLTSKFRGADELVSVIPVRPLNPGSLDNLLEASESLGKLDTLGEQVSSKHLTFLEDVAQPPRKREDLAEVLPSGSNLIPVSKYVRAFKWEPQYPNAHPVKALILMLQKKLNDTEIETKKRLQEYSELKNRASAASKKTDGNMTVKPISEAIKQWALAKHRVDKPIDTKFLTTLFVVLPKGDKSSWESSYVTLDGKKLGEGWVVPGSSDLVLDDGDFLLYSVVMFKTAVDAFKAGARLHKWTVRTFDPENEPSEAHVAEVKATLEAVRRKVELWLRNAFSEVFMAWMHVKVIRLYVEAILRYGLPPAFVPLCVVVNPKEEQRLRKDIDSLYKHLQSKYISDDGHDSGALQLQYPYVSLVMENLDKK